MTKKLIWIAGAVLVATGTLVGAAFAGGRDDCSRVCPQECKKVESCPSCPCCRFL